MFTLFLINDMKVCFILSISKDSLDISLLPGTIFERKSTLKNTFFEKKVSVGAYTLNSFGSQSPVFYRLTLSFLPFSLLSYFFFATLKRKKNFSSLVTSFEESGKIVSNSESIFSFVFLTIFSPFKNGQLC